MFPRLHDLVSVQRRKLTLGYVGRAASASPATGFHKTHELEQTAASIDAAHLSPRSSTEWPLSSPFPQLGESITEAVVGEVAQEGRRHRGGGRAVVVLETDKVTIDVPAPAGWRARRASRARRATR